MLFRLVCFLWITLTLAPALPAQQRTAPAKKKQPPTTLPPVKSSITVTADIPREDIDREVIIEREKKAAAAAEARGDLDEALCRHRYVVEVAGRLKESPHRFKLASLEQMARIHFARGEYDETEADLLELAQVTEEWGGPMESSVGHAYQNLAQLALRRDQTEKAENYVRRAIRTYDFGIAYFTRDIAPARNLDVCDSLANLIAGSKLRALLLLAQIQRKSGKLEPALETCDEAFRLGVQIQARSSDMVAVAQQAAEIILLSGRTDRLAEAQTGCDCGYSHQAELAAEIRKSAANRVNYWNTANAAGPWSNR